MKLIQFAILCAFVVGVAYPGHAQYKDYVRKETKKTLFTLSFDKQSVTISTTADSNSKIINLSRDKIEITPNQVNFTDDAVFSTSGALIHGTNYSFDQISDVLISADNDRTTIEFFEIESTSANAKKMREGNVITFSSPIAIEKGDFKRGLIFSVTGPVTVFGEVNKDIISLFGEIKLVTGSVARGHIVSISGKINVEQNASVYGEIYSGIKKYDSRRFRFYRDNEFEAGLMLDYNRVDGLTFGATAGYQDGDSSLPSVEVGIGYSFESKRPRNFVKASQLISRKKGLSIKAEYFRKLGSEDDWLLGDAENAVFVFLATEDFKDYYETEGFESWLELKPDEKVRFKAGYRFDNTRWLPANTHLWSLFGGSKLFRENFSSVEEPYRSIGTMELDSGKTGAILLNAEYDGREPGNDALKSGWNFECDLEWSNSDFGSDYDYSRYSLTGIRYQFLTKHLGLRVRGKFSNSDGYLPMYKRYFLGGFGTMRGYEHKEFMGTRYWLTNLEFWLGLPKIYNAYLIPFWDICQIANDTKLNGDAEIKNDIGLGLRITGIRLDISKRLDGAVDRDPQIFVRFSKLF